MSGCTSTRTNNTGPTIFIILITRHYPPEPSGGARRPKLFTDALRAAGHRVLVVSPFPQADDPDSLYVPHVLSAKFENSAPLTNPDEQRKTPFRDLLRTWLLWPDPEIRWAKRVQRALEASDYSPDWIITTNPPESLHVIAPRLKRIFGCLWAADLRDSWVVDPLRDVLKRSHFRRWMETKIGQQIFPQADALIAVSEDVLTEFQTLSAIETPCQIIGHFSHRFEGKTTLPSNALNIVHSGGMSLSYSHRHLSVVLDMILRVAKQRHETTFHLHIAGPLTTAELSALQQAETDCENFAATAHGSLSLTASRQLQMGADALLLHIPEGDNILSGKFSEYRQTRRPIFYTGEGDWIKLVDDVRAITPLESGLLVLQKGDFIDEAVPYGPDMHSAAQKLIDLLLQVDGSYKNQ